MYYSYYNFNSILVIIVGYLLLVGSIICILLYKIISDFKIFNLPKFLKNNYKLYNLKNYLFLRTQNLFKQSKQYSSTRYFKKK